MIVPLDDQPAARPATTSSSRLVGPDGGSRPASDLALDARERRRLYGSIVREELARKHRRAKAAKQAQLAQLKARQASSLRSD